MSNELKPSSYNTDAICGKVSGPPYTMQCTTSPMRGRYVMLQSTWSYNKHWLNFCEIEIMSCEPGKWGVNLPDGKPDCSRTCHCDDDEPCGVSDGLCHNQCSPGWWGVNCDKPCNCPPDVGCSMLEGCDCDKGWWGTNCTRPCGQCAGECNMKTGCEPDGCQNGYGGHLHCNISQYIVLLN